MAKRRAQDADDLLWWIHDCGTVMSAAERPGPHACDACANAPGPWAELWIWQGSTPTIRVDHPDDDQVEILVDGRVVASANFDDHGRDGMDAIERTALAVARAFGAEVRVRG